MPEIHLSYLRAFRNYANLQLNHATGFAQIGTYANILTEKANQLIQRASLNRNINLSNLQKDMFEAGGVYIKKFTFKYRDRKSNDSECEEYYFTVKDAVTKKE